MTTITHEVAGKTIAIRATLSKLGEVIHIDYVLKALEGGQKIAVFDALWDDTPDGQSKYMPGLAFVSVERGTLFVKRVFPPIPRKKNVEVAYVPWVRLLSQEEPLQGSIRLNIPIAEYSPYYQDDESYEEQAIEVVVLSLEFGILGEGVEVEPLTGLPGIYRLIRRQYTERCEVSFKLDHPVSVRRRKSVFERI